MPAHGDTYVGTMEEYGVGGGKAQQDAAYFRQKAQEAQNRGGVQVFDRGQDAYRNQEQGARVQQQSALGLLAGAANGQVPLQSQIVGRQQTSQAIAAQQAMAASARGPQAMALAQGQAAQNTAAAQAQIGNAQMANQAAEMNANRNAYFQAASGARSADLAAQGQRASEYGMQAQYNDAQRARNDAMTAQMYGNEIGINTQQQNAHNAGVANEQQYNVAKQNAETESKKVDYGMIKDSMSAGGGFMSAFMSDARTKEAVEDATPSEVEQLLGAFKGSKYRYKDEYADKPGGSRGDQFGPASAQEIARTKLGKSMVRKGDDGVQRIDTNAALKAVMSAVAHVNAKVEANRGR